MFLFISGLFQVNFTSSWEFFVQFHGTCLIEITGDSVDMCSTSMSKKWCFIYQTGKRKVASNRHQDQHHLQSVDHQLDQAPHPAFQSPPGCLYIFRRQGISTSISSCHEPAWQTSTDLPKWLISSFWVISTLISGSLGYVISGGWLMSWPVILPQAGIDTEYWRQSLELYEIFHRFVQGYLACYYPKKEDDFLMDKN